jgi:uncharacterized protein DUF3828
LLWLEGSGTAFRERPRYRWPMKLSGRRPVMPLLLFVFLCLISLAETGHPKVSSTSTSASKVVYAFYNWYLHSRFPNPGTQNLAMFKKYVTERFLKQAMDPDVEANLFIAAQDADPTWANHFSVSKPIIRNRLAITRVFLKGEKIYCTLRITLRRENSAWKIDNVDGSDWKSVGS